MRFVAGLQFHFSGIGWTGLVLLAAVFWVGYWAGSHRSEMKHLESLIDRIEERKTIDKLTAVTDKLHELVTSENGKTIDQIRRLFGRLIILERTGTAVALILAGIGVAAGIVASAAAPWIEGSGSFSGRALWHGLAIGVVAFVAVLVIFVIFLLLYRRTRAEMRTITKAGDTAVRAAVRLIRYAAMSGAADPPASP